MLALTPLRRWKTDPGQQKKNHTHENPRGTGRDDKILTNDQHPNTNTITQRANSKPTHPTTAPRRLALGSQPPRGAVHVADSELAPPQALRVSPTLCAPRSVVIPPPQQWRWRLSCGLWAARHQRWRTPLDYGASGACPSPQCVRSLLLALRAHAKARQCCSTAASRAHAWCAARTGPVAMASRLWNKQRRARGRKLKKALAYTSESHRTRHSAKPWQKGMAPLEPQKAKL